MPDANAAAADSQRQRESPPSGPRQSQAEIALVLADRHPIVLKGMQHLFESEPDFDVVACCTNEEDTRRAVLFHQPAVLVLDLHLPPNGGLALLGQFISRSTTVKDLAGSISTNEMTDAPGSAEGDRAEKRWRRTSSCSASGTCIEGMAEHSDCGGCRGMSRRETKAHECGAR
jgi:CheY-like chemotaxis protein